MDFCRKTILLLIFSSFMSVGWGQDRDEVIEATLSFGEVDLASQTIEIHLENSDPVSGFQFEVDSTITITDVSGGSAEDMGFMVDFSENNNVVLGFSIDGNEIPTGNDVLTILGFDGYGEATVCLSQASIVSGYENPQYFDVSYGDCITLDYMKGDVNLDESLDILDLVTIINIIFENISPDEYQIWASDYNSDGDINIMDIVQIVNCILTDCWEGEPSICDGLTEVELWGEWYDIGSTTSLDLWNSGLTGSIPPELGCLTNLTYLDLENNNLTGEIPSEIGNLTNLEFLNLNGNQLAGEIPSEIGNLTNLTYLDLENNNLTGEIPSEIGNLTNLTWLNLGDNQLTGDIPQAVCDLIESNNLDIYYILEGNNLINTCEEPEPSICDGLTEVELWGEWYDIETTTGIGFGSQGLTGSIPSEIGCLTNLTDLYLSNNQLTGEIPSEIGNLTNLEYLNLGGNELTGEIPSEIGNLTNLTDLVLYGNQLTGEIPSEIGNLTNLTSLSLHTNQLTGGIPVEIGNLTNLAWLALLNNQLSGEIPQEVCDLIESNNLDIYYILEGNNLINTCEEPEPSICDGLTEVELWGEWYDIGTTTSLYLSGQGLTGSIPPEIGCFPNLTILHLYNNQLTGEIPPEIGNLTNLEWLGLWDNQLTGEIPPEIGNLTNLTILDLTSNLLSGSIPPEIGNLTNLTYLNLDGNQLTGEIPSGIGNLTNLTDLSLADNQLTGEIPPEIENLTNLTFLYLNDNQLTGEIPSEIGNLTNLTVLVLFENQLSGEIPPEVCDLIENNNWVSGWSFEDYILAGNNLINTCEEPTDVCEDIDGNVYETIQIGEQLWMAENLKVTRYNDGTPIPTGYSNPEWAELETGAYAVYPTDDDDASQTTCGDDCADVYGNLYNWYVVDDDRGVCPEGWHVPSDEEWTDLITYLDVDAEASSQSQSQIAGGMLKDTGIIEDGDGLWDSPNAGATNESGFTGLPAGYRYYNIGFSYMGGYGYFWSSSETISFDAWNRRLSYSYSSVYRFSSGKHYGFSVRCLGD